MRKLLGAGCMALMMLGTAQAAETAYSVKSSVDSTLSYHRQLKSIQENRMASEYDVRRAEAGWYPKLDVTAGGGGSYLNDKTTRAEKTDKSMYGNGYVGLTLTQPIWDGKATANRVDMAMYQLSSMDYRVLDNATTLALDAVIAHARVLLQRELVQYAYETVNQHVEILNAQMARQKSGTSTLADVNQVEGRLARSRSQLAEAQGNLRDSEENYQRVTGMPAPPQLETVDMPTSLYPSMDDCLNLAQKNNPKILAYVEDSKKANAQQALSRSAYSPTVNIEAKTGFSDKDSKGNNWNSYADVMLVGRWNIFNGGADRAGELVAGAQYRQSRQDMFNMSDTLKQEVANAWTRFNTSKEQRDFYALAMDYNKRTRAGFMEQFLIGQRSLLDVLDAASEYYSSSTQWATARTNVMISAYTMYALAGELLNYYGIDNSMLLRAPSED